MSDPLHLLVFGPHPDDVEIWCGGLVASLAAQGYRVGIADVTRGEAATRGTPEQREEEAKAAARILGVTVRENLGLADGHLESDAESRRAFVEAIRRHRPAILLAPHPSDDHPDHAAAGRLARDTLFLAGLRKYDAQGVAHRARQVWHYMCHQPFPPSFIADVTHVFERKMESIRAYASQLHSEESREPATNVSSPDFLERLEARMRHFGSLAGVRYGEPYFVETPVRLEDPLAPWIEGVERAAPEERR
jgi:bacillithiol biosynthesis deacetylase BshB1